MPLNLLATAKAAVLGTAMLAAPLSAQDAVKKADFEAVQKDVKDIKDEIASLKSLGKQLKELKDTLEGKTDGGKDDGVLKAVKRMDDALAALDKKVQSLENKVTDFATRTAGSSPLAGGAAPAPAPAPAPAVTTAKVKIVNEYPVQISMLVNGVPHRVEPNSTVEVPVSAGSLRYQLLTAGANEVPSVVRAGETVTLRVK